LGFVFFGGGRTVVKRIYLYGFPYCTTHVGMPPRSALLEASFLDAK
jgi:hypothetical protein